MALLSTSDLVQGAVEELDHVVAIDGQAGIGEVLPDVVPIGLPEVGAEA